MEGGSGAGGGGGGGVGRREDVVGVEVGVEVEEAAEVEVEEAAEVEVEVAEEVEVEAEVAVVEGGGRRRWRRSTVS